MPLFHPPEIHCEMQIRPSKQRAIGEWARDVKESWMTEAGCQIWVGGRELVGMVEMQPW